MTLSPAQKLDRKALLKVAHKLQGGYSKETTGEPIKWADVPADEQNLWIRLATRAANVILAEHSAT